MSGDIILKTEEQTEPDEFNSSDDLEEISENSTEPDDLKEVAEAIDSIVKDSETDSIDNFTDFNEYDFEAPQGVEPSYNNILKYWLKDEAKELSTYYDTGYQLKADPSFKKEITAQENKVFNTAMKTNFNARMKHEYGVSFGQTETIDQEARNLVFKSLNPSMWKFMYEASSFLVFSEK